MKKREEKKNKEGRKRDILIAVDAGVIRRDHDWHAFVEIIKSWMCPQICKEI